MTIEEALKLLIQFVEENRGVSVQQSVSRYSTGDILMRYEIYIAGLDAPFSSGLDLRKVFCATIGKLAEHEALKEKGKSDGAVGTTSKSN